MTDLVMSQHDSCENAKEFIMMSQHIMPHPIVSQNASANPKNQSDIRETSVRHPIRHFFTSGEQTINGICMHCNMLLNDNKSIPQTVFTKNTKMKTVWLLKTNSISFMVDLVYKIQSSHCIFCKN